jgi:ATP-dependent RNA helicase RhlE
LPNFSDLGLSAPILGTLATEGYAAPTPIQSQAIPPVLGGRDLCGIAQTGTGKTAAFALPILQRLAAVPQRAAPQTCRALVLSPTRELASQIADSFRAYGAGLPLSTAVYGGVSIGPQRQKVARGVDILVATPGRLLDLIDTRSLTLSSVKVLVLDEARPDARPRLHPCAEAHREAVAPTPANLAVLGDDAAAHRCLAEDYLNDPVKVVVAPSATTVERVEQGVVFVPSDRKRDLLATLLRDPVFARVLVFTRTKHGADRVVRHLVSAGIDATAIHGNKSQPQRERALAGFRYGQTRILVATDIAARGIDVDGVSHVINFELPSVPEDYVHRVGRTARAGAAGIAIAFCSDEERPYLRDIEKLTRCSLRPIPVPSATPAPRNGPIERPASSKPPREGSLASRHPPRSANADIRRGEQPVTGPLPAFPRRPPPTKPGSAGRRSEQRGRSAATRWDGAS